MSDLEAVSSGTSIPGEAAPTAQPVAAYEREERDTPSDDGETADRARSQGWVPKEEFRGDPSKWRDAAEFIKRGEEIVPILKERTKTLASKLEAAEAKLQQKDREDAEKFARLERMTETALARQRDQLVSSYDAAMRSAVELGDVARFDQLKRDQVVAVQRLDQQVEQVAPRQQPPQHQANQPPPEYVNTVKQWEQRNPWIADPELDTVARIYSNKLAQEKPGISLEDNLKATEGYIKQRYADKFPKAQAGSPSVEGGGRMSATGSRAKGVAELPADVRKVAARFVAQGLYKNEAEYAKDYWSQD